MQTHVTIRSCALVASDGSSGGFGTCGRWELGNSTARRTANGEREDGRGYPQSGCRAPRPSGCSTRGMATHKGGGGDRGGGSCPSPQTIHDRRKVAAVMALGWFGGGQRTSTRESRFALGVKCGRGDGWSQLVCVAQLRHPWLMLLDTRTMLAMMGRAG